MRLPKPILLAVAAALCVGCGDYKGRTAGARSAFYAGRYTKAAAAYSRGSDKPGRDRLLNLLDAGMALRAARDYEASNRRFVAADELIEDLNFRRRAGEAAASALSDDRALTYRGEEFETVLVNTFMALNFLQAGGDRAAEKALVECRRLDWKLREYSELRGRKYLQNAFARYLSGVAYELDGQPNDAYIDYRAVHELQPDFAPVRADLVRLSAALGFADHQEDWENKFGTQHDAAALQGTGEVVLVLECGRAPEKNRWDENFLDLPRYYSFPRAEAGGELRLGSRPLGRTGVLEDIDATARRTLEDRMGPIVARRLTKAAIRVGAGVAVRHGVREATRRNMKGADSRALADIAGILAYLILDSLDRPDTRCWMTLPASLQVARARLPAGTHTLRLHMLGPEGGWTGHVVEFPDVQVRPGGITLLSTRTLR